MSYYLDLESITIDRFKDILKTMELIPSWKILADDVDIRMDTIKQSGINNLEDLLSAFKKKELIQDFSSISGLPEKYLEVLNRMVKGFRAKPNRIKDFTCIKESTVEKLEETGIKNTLKLYPRVLTNKLRKNLSDSTGIDSEEIIMLAKLTDLSRIRWVNHTFAYVLYESGFETVDKVAKSDYQEMYDKIKALNKDRELYKGQIGLKDMKMVIESAKMLNVEIEYL